MLSEAELAGGERKEKGLGQPKPLWNEGCSKLYTDISLKAKFGSIISKAFKIQQSNPKSLT